jgi:hypothetical protein
MEPRGTLLGSGYSRACYADGRWVIKVPLNDYGLADNSREARLSRRWGRGPDQNGVLYARCRLLKNGWLVMERVDTSVPDEAQPRWADYVDCQQVGLTRAGRIVAYDFGY